MSRPPIVTGIGELLWDVLPTGKLLGGAPCNFAYHAMQGGCISHVISAVGRDLLGDELLGALNQLGLSDQYIQKNNFSTSTVTIKLDRNGHPDYTIHEQVAWDHLEWNSALEELANETDAVCFGSLAQRNTDSKETIQKFLMSLKSTCLKVFDINLRQHYYSKELLLASINLADVLKLNDDELPVISTFLGISGDLESQLRTLRISANLKYIIYTMGSKGSIIHGDEEYSDIEAPIIEVADTVGAGDAFTAVFISGILHRASLHEIHRKATEIAAYVCSQKGATPKTIFSFN